MTDCPNAEMRDRLPDWVHGSLSAPDAAAIAEHVAMCAACRAESELLRALRGALTREPAIDVERIAATVTTRTLGPEHRQAPRGSWRLIAGGIAVAASLLVGALLLRGDAESDARLAPVATIATGQGDDSAVAGAPVDSPSLSTGPAAGPEPAIRLAAAGLAAGGAFSDLGDEQLEALLRRLDAIEAVPQTSPAPAITTDYEVR